MTQLIKNFIIDPRAAKKSFTVEMDSESEILSMHSTNLGQLVINFRSTKKPEIQRTFHLVNLNEEINESWKYHTSVYLPFFVTFEGEDEEKFLVKKDVENEFFLFEEIVIK